MVRKNNWSKNDDTILAETVLSCIQNGETQLKAFEEAAEKLGRTAAACGFRWNSVVRKEYKERLKKRKTTGRNTPSMNRIIEQMEDNINKPLVDVFNYIKELEQKIEDQNQEIGELKEQIQKYKERYIANDELQTLMKIISNARDKGFLNKAN